MDEARLARALTGLLSKELAEKLTVHFVMIRRDLATKTLERASPGKFVETLVQGLQYIDTRTYDAKPDVDTYLDKKVENTGLPEGLRICAARVGRAVYTMRNKRNIAHNGEVDPNSIDLAFVHQASAWVMAELLRNATGISMQEAGALIDLVQAPIGALVEDVGDTRLIHADVSARVELLILLQSNYPDVVPVADILNSLSRRRAKGVKERLRELHNDKLAHGSAKTGYRLTQTGYAEALSEAANRHCQSKSA